MTEPIGESLEQTRLCCPVVELRQYTLHPGKRDVLIDLFDREFIEPQEALGIKSSVNLETLIVRISLFGSEVFVI